MGLHMRVSCYGAGSSPRFLSAWSMRMGRSLYSITEDLLALDQLIEDAEGDITDVEEVVNEWFGELGDELEIKLDNYAAYIRELEARAKVRKEESDRLASRARTAKNNADFLKGRLQWFFEMRSLKKMETPRFTLTLQKNGGKLPLLIDVETEKLPEIYQLPQPPIADKDAIRAALEEGEEIEGCALGERGQSIRIR